MDTLVSLSVNFDLIGLHDLLNLLSKFAEADINTSGLDTGIGGSFDSLFKSIELGIEAHGEGAINNVSVDVSAEIDLANVVVAEDSWIASIWRVMGSAVVE